jgi:hypothetical protein
MNQALWSRPETTKRYLNVWLVMCASVADSSVPVDDTTADPAGRYTDMALYRYTDMFLSRPSGPYGLCESFL